MSDALSRLIKILALERKQGYRNKAVIGGLDKFASRWEADARTAAGPDSAAISDIVSLLLGYPAVEDIAAREMIIDQIAVRAEAAAAEIDGQSAATRMPRVTEVDRPASPVTREPQMPRQNHPSAQETPAKAGGERLEEAAARENDLSLPTPAKPQPASPEPSPSPVRPIRPPSKPEAAPHTRTPAPPAVAELEAPPAKADRSAIRGTGLDAPVTRLPNVGPSLAQKLEKLGVRTVRDLLYLLPTRYDDYSRLRTIDKLKYQEQVTVIGTCWDLKSRIIGENRRMITALVGDGTGEMLMTWFNPFVERRLRAGRAYTFSGKVDSYKGRLLIRNPEFEPLEKSQVHTGRLVPVYPATEGLTVRWLRKIMKDTVDAWAADLPDFLSDDLRLEARLIPLGKALAQIHFPDNQEQLSAAHRRLSFDEFLLLQLGVLGHRKRFRDQAAQPLGVDEATYAPFLASLPFSLTGAQQRALQGISSDLRSPHPMSRLLQGDVGSGKTAVAAAALWAAVANGAQGAIMAPTEILAEQHARSFEAMFAGLENPVAERPVRVALFSGSMRRSERVAALETLAAGEIDIAVGTHALIQDDVFFKNLAVAVVDEQHRFGVEQRGALRKKGLPPHVLVMSATPIPRSLAMTIYGDLDISVIDEMPAGRLPVKTKWLASSQRERVYDFIRRQVQSGRQTFIIYPLVEEGENSQVGAAVEEHARLSNVVFPGMRVGLMHGRLKGEEKDAVMRAFGSGELDILVATSVVEVGIDVPNATVIVIEGADRFGLAQLHQFRGRVGRGEHPSYCILISDADEQVSVERLQALENSSDGFALAQVDLEMRGPGDFFGTRQSGLPPLRTAKLSDIATLEAARAVASRLFASDPALERQEHRALAEQVAAFWAGAGDFG